MIGKLLVIALNIGVLFGLGKKIYWRLDISFNSGIKNIKFCRHYNIVVSPQQGGHLDLRGVAGRQRVAAGADRGLLRVPQAEQDRVSGQCLQGEERGRRELQEIGSE